MTNKPDERNTWLKMSICPRSSSFQPQQVIKALHGLAMPRLIICQFSQKLLGISANVDATSCEDDNSLEVETKY